MILDNADDTEIFFSPSDITSPEPARTDRHASKAYLARYIPECSHGSILVTTRNKETGVRLTRGRGVMKIEHMNPAESRELIQEVLEDDHPNSDHLALLTARLEHLPLALVQAAAFIQESSMTIARYLHLLDQSDITLVELLSQPFEAVGRDSRVPHAVTATWMVSFKQIQEQYHHASHLLSLMSFFDRQGIPKAFLSHRIAPQHNQDPAPTGDDRALEVLELEKALGVLKGFSFISDGSTNENLNIHRLIQLVMRKWLITQGTSGAWAGQALTTVSELYPPGSYANWKVCEDYLPHAYVVLSHEGSSSPAEAVAQGCLLHNTALFMLYRGQWKKAEELQVQAVATRMRVLGEEHPDTLASMANLASTYRNQGRWTEAEELEVQVMRTRKRVLGEEHPSTLTSMANLASTFWKQGRWTEAEKLFVQVMETSLKVLGKGHPSTLTSMANLASAWKHQGRHNEAAKLINECEERMERRFGVKHPNTKATLNILVD
jgi:Tetratricopeptide repeat